MAFGVFLHRSDSIYDDVPAERYQFPQQYLKRAQECVGGWVVYLEPSKVKGSRGYYAVAKVHGVVRDPQNSKMHLALIEPGTYLDFGDPVPFRDKGEVVEQGLLNDRGKISGRAQAAVRALSPSDFSRIIELGLGREDGALPRLGEATFALGFSEAQAPYEITPAQERIRQLTTRTARDRNFRKNVLRAYGERCAITGLRLINGGGRAEAEAAHIKPVGHNGPDIVSNGLALSGTVHWMFDRGLIGLSDELAIVISRQANDREAIKSMINTSGRLLSPQRPADRPHPAFVKWHRENCFKH